MSRSNVENQGNAIKFISVDPRTKSKSFGFTNVIVTIVHDEAMEFLKQIVGLIAVVIVAGESRSGKSTLWNWCTGDSTAFVTGDTY